MNEDANQDEKSFEEAANEASPGIVKEFLFFLRENKAWWMVPILLAFILIFVVAWMASSPVLAPFIYPLF